jgi:hypothetical protein
MVTKEEMARIKFEVFNDLEDEINRVTYHRSGDVLDEMDVLHILADCCIRIWSRQEVKSEQELPDDGR